MGVLEVPVAFGSTPISRMQLRLEQIYLEWYLSMGLDERFNPK